MRSIQQEVVLGPSFEIIPDDLPFYITDLNEPVAVTRQAVNRCNPKPGHKAIVFVVGSKIPPQISLPRPRDFAMIL